MAKKGGVATNLNGFLNPTTTRSQRDDLIDTSDEIPLNDKSHNDGDFNPPTFAKMSISYIQDMEQDLARQQTEQPTGRPPIEQSTGPTEQSTAENMDTSFCIQVTTPIGVFDVPIGKCQHYRPRFQDMCPKPVRSDGFAEYCNDHTKSHFTSIEDEETKQLQKKTLFLMQMKRHNDKQVEKDELTAATFVHCRTAHSISQKERKIANSTIKLLLQTALNSTVPIVNSVPIAKPKPTVIPAPTTPPKKSIAKEQPKKL